MKRIMVGLLAVMLLVACGTSKPKPNPDASTWNSVRWNESNWEK
jgi:outer membrane biogenesis lipoprotein LolB